MFIVITSKNQDPSNFISNFIDSVNINDGYEIALTAMFHGPLYNIDDRHNRFTLTSNEYEAMEYRIPPNFYESTVELLLAIQNTLLDDMKISGSILKVAPTVKVDVNGVFHMVLNKEKGKVVTPTVKIFNSLAALATTCDAPVPVPPPIPEVMKTIFAPCI